MAAVVEVQLNCDNVQILGPVEYEGFVALQINQCDIITGELTPAGTSMFTI